MPIEIAPRPCREQQQGTEISGHVEAIISDTKGGLVTRDEMANAKEFDAGSIVATQALKCTNRPTPGPCLGPRCARPQPCLIPPKCGTGPCKNTL